MQTTLNFTGRPASLPQKIIFALISVASIILGLMLGTVMLGLGAIATLYLSARIWWLRRQYRNYQVNHGPAVFDGEYRVIDWRDENKQRNEYF